MLGAGIGGCSTALWLARTGVEVQLLDMRVGAMQAASCWNEGKIHLGYLYGRDATLATARRILPGGLAFRRLTLELTGRDPAVHATDHDDTMLIHRASVVTADEYWAYAQQVADLTARQPDAGEYLVDVRSARPRRLEPAEWAGMTPSTDIVGAVSVPERSVSTTALAGAFAGAVREQRGITTRWGARVADVVPSAVGGWMVGLHDIASPAAARPADREVEMVGPWCAVVNALWEGRPAIDARVGLPPAAQISHRYRMSVFATARRPLGLRSAVVGVGPFGDVKNYDGRHVYASWYPVGLLAYGTETVPPDEPALDGADRLDLARRTLAGLRPLFPGLPEGDDGWTSIQVQGGWVYATEAGDLADPHAGLHRRDDVGVSAAGSYVTLNTGKYSLGPLLGREAAQAALAALSR